MHALTCCEDYGSCVRYTSSKLGSYKTHALSWHEYWSLLELNIIVVSKLRFKSLRRYMSTIRTQMLLPQLRTWILHLINKLLIASYFSMTWSPSHKNIMTTVIHQSFEHSAQYASRWHSTWRIVCSCDKTLGFGHSSNIVCATNSIPGSNKTKSTHSKR